MIGLIHVPFDNRFKDMMVVGRPKQPPRGRESPKLTYSSDQPKFFSRTTSFDECIEDVFWVSSMDDYLNKHNI